MAELRPEDDVHLQDDLMKYVRQNLKRLGILDNVKLDYIHIIRGVYRRWRNLNP